MENGVSGMGNLLTNKALKIKAEVQGRGTLIVVESSCQILG